MNNMRRGFTMIELIFVIVIIGILAAVAIPKLAATRDDAKIVSALASGKQALMNLGAEYTSQGAFTNYTIADANAAADCFTFAEPQDGNVTVAIKSPCDNAAVLAAVTAQASDNGLTGVTHQFGGVGVKF